MKNYALLAGMVFSSFVLAPGHFQAAAKAASVGKKQSTPAATGKKPAPSAAAKKAAAEHQAVLTNMVATKQAEGLTDCAAFKAHLDDLIPANVFAAEVGRNLGKRLDDMDFEKGEYETTTESEARAFRVLKVFVGAPDRAVFAIPIDDEHQQFDADAGMLHVTLPTTSYSDVYRSGYESLLMEENDKYLGKKRGQTALGIKFNYEEWIEADSYLGIDSTSFSQFARTPINKDSTYSTYVSEESKAVDLSVTGSQAISYKYGLELRILGSIEAPWFASDTSESTASLDDPTETYTYSEAYFIKPLCAYLYDTTGKSVVFTYLEDKF